jgi:hypothetical protein
MEREFRILTVCCLAMIAALLIVGAVFHGLIRHVVQTSPLWIIIVLSVRRLSFTKWAALPCFLIWLLLMTSIWLYLLGWARIITGRFSPTEIAMTLVVGVASLIGIAKAIGMKSSVRAWRAIAAALLFTVLQTVALRLSFLPEIAHR